MIFSAVIKVISWQLFNVKDVFVNSLSFPAGIPFLFLTVVFLVYSVYLIFAFTKANQNIVERSILSVFIYSISVCVILSLKGLAPLTPTRHNLFLSPALFAGFFICAKHAYDFLKIKYKKINEEHFIIFLLILSVMPSLARDYQTANSPEIRELLVKIQSTVKNGERVCVSMKKNDLPVFRYEYYYSNIPWIKHLKEEDISEDFSFRAGNDKYDYQWYILSHVKLSEKEALKKLKYTESNSRNGSNFIVDLEYSLPPKISGFRALRSGLS
ncbi:MAG: hypothetical protein PHX78_12425 [bacterium]|nr:hypothetical protein [bacterium]